MVLPLIAVARGAAAVAGRSGASRAATTGASEMGGAGGRYRKARQLQKEARRGYGKLATKTKFTGEKPSKMLYLGVGLIALLKDLLDLVGIGSLPALGTIVTICLTFLIWILLTVFDKSGAKSNMQQTRGMVVIFFGLVEAIGFGLNFLPIETLMVIVLYSLAKKAWKKQKEEAENGTP